jgi:signal peptide peptidase SppA
MSGICGYDKIKADLDYAFSDEDVDDITLLMNSSGGEVIGCFELADYIYQNRETKYMTAMVSGLACSACYMLASACNEIVSSATSYTGSIGVITAHTSYEKMLEEKGLKITLITSGDNKADGNPYSDLPEEVFNKIHANVVEIHTMFAERVAKFRGITLEAVFNTKASSYLARQSLELNLIDGIVSPIDYIDKLSHTSGNNLQMESQKMADDKTMVTKADHDTALVQATAAGKEAGLKEGATGMQSRIKSILMCDEAADKSNLAMTLAMTTEMSADCAKNILLAAASEGGAVIDEPVVSVTDNAAKDFKAAIAAEAAEAVGSDAMKETGLNADEDSVEFAMASAKLING